MLWDGGTDGTDGETGGTDTDEPSVPHPFPAVPDPSVEPYLKTEEEEADPDPDQTQPEDSEGTRASTTPAMTLKTWSGTSVSTRLKRGPARRLDALL
jgi:hypothetical protein